MDIKVCFVCMGNICRSPTAQGVFQQLLDNERLAGRIQIDSAGTHAYHVGEPPDRRAQEAAKRRSIDISKQRARKVVVADFELFDYVIAMDADNKNALIDLCPVQYQHRISLFMDYAEDYKQNYVPDPYYGGQSGFEIVLDMVESASLGLLATIKKEKGL